MLTLRIVMSNGHEIIQEADCVVLYPKMETGADKDVLVYTQNVHADKGSEISEGHIYVMNELGKTVARYHLFPPGDERTEEQKENDKLFGETLNIHEKIAEELREERKTAC